MKGTSKLADELLDKMRSSGMRDVECSLCQRAFLTRETGPNSDICPPCRKDWPQALVDVRMLN